MTLRARLVLASVVIVLVVVGGALTILRSQEAYLIDQVDEQLLASQPFLRFAVPPAIVEDPLREPPPSPPAQPVPATDTPISEFYVARVEAGQVVPLLQGQLLDDTPKIDSAAIGDLGPGEAALFTASGTSGHTRFRVSVNSDSTGEVTLIAAKPLSEVDDAIRRLRLELAVMSVTIVAVLALVIWWLQRLGLRPIAKVTAVADEISAGERDRRVDATHPRTEAGRLAAAFNAMLDERDATEMRLRQFVADASHELRTPLTSFRGYLDLYSDGGFRRDGELDDIVRRMSHESSRMNELVEDLLTLARLDEQLPLRNEQVDIQQLLDNAAMDARAIEPGRKIDVVEPTGDVTVFGDGHRLQQVVAILVDNPITHTPGTQASA